MRSLLLSLGLLAALLLAMPAPAPTNASTLRPAPAGPPVLVGRNCGGTSRPGMLALNSSPALAGTGWVVGGALDAAPAAGTQQRPSIAASPAGTIFYAWQEGATGDIGNILAAAVAAAPPAGRLGVRVDDTGAAKSEQAAPSLAIDEAGQLHMVWEDLRSGQRGLFYANSSNGGATWSANTLLTGALPSLSHIVPHLLAGPGGALYLAWDGGSNIYFSRRIGGVWSVPTPINAPLAGDRDLPRLALDAQGRLIAAWEDRRNPTPVIYVARLDQPATGAWGAEQRASPAATFAAQPSLAASDDGPLYLAYQGGPGIYLMTSGDGGTTWGPARRVDDGDGNAFTNPRVAVDERGGVHCVWCRLRVNVVADVVAARSLDGGVSWGERATLASTTSTAEPLDLIAHGGTLYAAWSDDRDGTPRLHTARWSEGGGEGGQLLYLPLLRR